MRRASDRRNDAQMEPPTSKSQITPSRTPTVRCTSGVSHAHGWGQGIQRRSRMPLAFHTGRCMLLSCNGDCPVDLKGLTEHRDGERGRFVQMAWERKPQVPQLGFKACGVAELWINGLGPPVTVMRTPSGGWTSLRSFREQSMRRALSARGGRCSRNERSANSDSSASVALIHRKACRQSLLFQMTSTRRCRWIVSKYSCHWTSITNRQTGSAAPSSRCSTRSMSPGKFTKPPQALLVGVIRRA
mmetsp:Transcript_40843/g.68460  ORF Transcript_40843/g.68460 Transcript_40843/m.68460 type:complete len:244 (+) Transcript_40843:613-1344(+)